MSVLRAMPLLTVSDLDAAVDAHTRITGMEVIMNHGWIATLAPPADHSVQVSLITKDPTGPVNPSASIEVEDVDAAHEAALSAGTEIVYGPADEEWGVRRFFFKDPDGNVVNVLSHL
ncbi:VOC family protein [Streptomyces sp. NBC_01754]|uniref:VOC family protein n=1 Tax=Streptomyces sp. NBC_01754 TaxID=2975930 RepID=UPI002DDA74E6|nr:VOC family protein [Streptomyces sp. NBC_01754]WSC95806.1 VOC family protein [Streptomyces sp. NBC_01754]